MTVLDKYFRWCLYLFVFLMVLQLALFLFLKKAFHQAKQRLEDNKAKVEFLCGDFRGEESYWKLNQSLDVSQCQGLHCPESYWQNRSIGEEELHVLSVRKARPNRHTEKGLEHGHFVKAKVAESQKPITLALISQSVMQWSLQVSPGSSLKEVLVIGPEVVWVKGLPEGVKLSFFSKDQICSFPTAWEDIKNPDNQFRRLFQALRQYTGLEVSSFQGRKVGWEMRVPFHEFTESGESPVDRGISSHGIPDPWNSRIQWRRNRNQLQASKIHFVKEAQVKEINLPKKTTEVLYEAQSDQLFVINKYRFGKWNGEKKQFSPIDPPLTMRALGWPGAMAFNSLTNELYIYNDERGGEIFSYNVVTGVWNLFSVRMGGSLVALYFDRQKKWLYGTRFKGDKIPDLVAMNEQGQVTETRSLKKALDFSKNRWRAQMISQGVGQEEKFWLKVARPTNPQGELHFLIQKGKDQL